MKRKVELTPDVNDYDDAPEFFVEGIRLITRVSDGVVRVSYFAERDDNDKKVIVDLLWDARSFFASLDLQTSQLVLAAISNSAAALRLAQDGGTAH